MTELSSNTSQSLDKLPSRRRLIGLGLAGTAGLVVAHEPVLQAIESLTQAPIARADVQTFATQCADARVINHPEWSIKNIEVTGVLLCFSDFSSYYSQALDSAYRGRFKTLLDTAGPFYNQFMGLNVTTKLYDGYVQMTNPSTFYRNSGTLMNEVFYQPGLIKPSAYGGNTFKSYCLVPVGDATFDAKFGPLGGLDQNVGYGEIVIPGYFLDTFKNGQPKTNSKLAYWHEFGHTLGMAHNFTNRTYSIMDDGTYLYDGNPKGIDAADIQGICVTSSGESTPTPTPTKSPTPVVGSPTPTPTMPANVKPKLYLPDVNNVYTAK